MSTTKICFNLGCPICGDLIACSGEVGDMSANARVEPIDRAPLDEHMATAHPGTVVNWGATRTYPDAALLADRVADHTEDLSRATARYVRAEAEVERLRRELGTTIARADDMHESMVRQRDALAVRVEALTAEVERLRADYDDALNTVAAWVPRAERAEAQVGAVRALHANEDGYCDACADDAPAQVQWEPCATIHALDG